MMVFYFSDFLFFLRSAEYKLPYVTSQIFAVNSLRNLCC